MPRVCSFCHPSEFRVRTHTRSRAMMVPLRRRLKNCFSNIDFWHDKHDLCGTPRLDVSHVASRPDRTLSFVFERLIYDRLLCALVNAILVSRGSRAVYDFGNPINNVSSAPRRTKKRARRRRRRKPPPRLV